MKDIKKIQISVVQENELRNESSVVLNNHDIPKYCPIDEVESYQVTLERRDLERIFILFQIGFLDLTNKNTFKLSDLIVTTARKIDRVQSFLNDETFDLRSHPNSTIILFGKNLDTSFLTATDGNHRLMAHYIEHENIDGIPAFIYIHKSISNSSLIPPLARV